MNKILNKKLITTLLVFIGYIFYSNVFVSISNLLGLGSGVEIYFVADVLFLFAIIMLYKDNLKKDYNIFIEKYDRKKKIFKVLKYIILLFGSILIYGLICSIFFPGLNGDENAASIVSLFKLSSIYTLFKTLIFASIAEELVFKESLSEVITNKILFVILSSLIYATMNIIYTDLSSAAVLISFGSYLLMSMILATAYVKNDNNIFLVILIKFCYNLIPTLLLISGAF